MSSLFEKVVRDICSVDEIVKRVSPPNQKKFYDDIKPQLSSTD